MSTELIVQNSVIALILIVASWFVVRHLRDRFSAPRSLGDGDQVSLVKVGHVANGADVRTGAADRSSGGRLIWRVDGMTLKWGLGLAATEIEYQRMCHLRVQSFGLTDIVTFDMRDEDRYWALAINRRKTPALLTWLTERGVHPAEQTSSPP